MFYSGFKSNYINLDKKFKLITIIVFLLPFSLIIGPATLEPLLLILSLFGLNFFYKKNIILKINNLIFLILLFYLFSVLSSLLSDYKLFSLKSSLPMIRFYLSIFVIFYFLKKNDWFENYYFNLIYFILIIILIDGLTQTITGYNLILLKSKSSFLITGFFGEEKVLGRYITVITSLLIGLYFSIYKKKKKIIYLVVIVIFANSFLIFTSERISMFYGMVIISLFIILLSQVYGKKYLMLFFLPLLIFFIFFKYSSNNFFYNKINDTILQITDNKSKILFYSKEHENFANTSIEIFKNKPLIGVGPKNYRHECRFISAKYTEANNCSTHPHNNFFQVLSEVGIIGAFIYLLIFLKLITLFFKHLLKYKIKQFALIFFLLPTIFYMNPILPSGNLFNNWNMMMGLLTIPFYLNFKKKNDNR